MMSRNQREGGSHFCHTMCEVVSKATIFARQEKRGGSKNLQVRVTSFMNFPFFVPTESQNEITI